MFRTSGYIPVVRPLPHSTATGDDRSPPMGEIHLRFLAAHFNLSFAQTVRPSTSFHVAGPAFHFYIPHRHFAYSSAYIYCTTPPPPATASWAAHVPPSPSRAAALREFILSKLSSMVLRTHVYIFYSFLIKSSIAPLKPFYRFRPQGPSARRPSAAARTFVMRVLF